MSNEVDKIVTVSTIKELRQKVDAALAEYDNVELLVLSEELKVKVEEELSTNDWTKFGMITGLLWYKFDTLINYLKTIDGALRNIERNTTRIK